MPGQDLRIAAGRIGIDIAPLVHTPRQVDLMAAIEEFLVEMHAGRAKAHRPATAAQVRCIWFRGVLNLGIVQRTTIGLEFYVDALRLIALRAYDLSWKDVLSRIHRPVIGKTGAPDRKSVVEGKRVELAAPRRLK